ncbi:unnamed protein product, partial [marine sediment metagenome]
MLEFEEGKVYSVRVAVTNQTFMGGQPWEATLKVVIFAAMNGVGLIPYDTWDAPFAAGETKDFVSSQFSVPRGYSGITGEITVDVFDPADKHIAGAVESLIVIPTEEPPPPTEFQFTVRITNYGQLVENAEYLEAV